MRAFGGGHGSHSNHKYVKYSVKSRQTIFKIPSEADVAHELPKEATFNEKLHMWINGRWDSTRDDVLDNTNIAERSAYHNLAKLPA